ncbi:hypothetical protein T492DRAFT_844972 [Pavlovales sp. CCMP2436]|nr:hypothetical protein T492DRAFT_844972 [Pavlovales sp. CCMP2436]
MCTFLFVFLCVCVCVCMCVCVCAELAPALDAALQRMHAAPPTHSFLGTKKKSAALQRMYAAPQTHSYLGEVSVTGLALRPLLGAGLAMGDEAHNSNKSIMGDEAYNGFIAFQCKAITSLLVQAFAPALIEATAGSEAAVTTAAAVKSIQFLSGNAHFGKNDDHE